MRLLVKRKLLKEGFIISRNFEVKFLPITLQCVHGKRIDVKRFLTQGIFIKSLFH